MYALIFVSILWAFSFGLIKGQLTGIDPSLVAAIRLSLCFILFIPFMSRRALPEKPFHFIGLGMIQFGVMYWAYIQSYQYLPGYLVAVFTIFTPLYIILIDAMFKRTFSLAFLPPVVLSIIGAAVIVFKSPEQSNYLQGFLILQVANIAFALGQVCYRFLAKKSQSNHMSHMLFMYAGGALFALSMTGVKGGFEYIEHITSQQWLVLCYLGIIASGIGFSLWNYGAKQVSAVQLAIMNNGYIPFAVIFALTIFNEPADITKLLIGGSLMAVSLWWSKKVSVA